MHNRFITIGVAQGDAFFLEREDFTALIDGGRSEKEFSCKFQESTKHNSINILVCTHNDADHANGVVGFLEAGLRCDEVWLPASWAYRLNYLISDPRGFFYELIDDIFQLEGNHSGEEGNALEQLGDDYVQNMGESGNDYVNKIPADRKTNNPETDPLSLDRIIEGVLSERDYPYPFDLASCVWPPIVFAKYFSGNAWHYRLFREGIETGKRIRQIALLAYHRGYRIRWFEYINNSGASGGCPGKLIPVNAREVCSLQAKELSVLRYLALTITNRQSLVFFSPTSEGPGILLTADSDLNFSNPIPWNGQKGMIITAPHHGSESNKNAYLRYQNEMPVNGANVWVRSDGRFRSRPGSSYLNLKDDRFCTICRGPQQAKQDIPFTLRN